MIIFGAGLIGEVALFAARDKHIHVEAVIDDRITGYLHGTEIITTQELARIYSREVPIVLTSPNIADMIAPLERLGFRNWKGCEELLRDYEIGDGLNLRWRDEYSPDHVRYLVATCIHHQYNYLNPKRLVLPNIDVIVTERCSMKCRDCSNLMQYYEHPENADLNLMLASIDALCADVDEIYEARVIGGEPFMNRDMHLIVEHLCAKAKVTKVCIFTNGTIVPRDLQWEALRHDKVRFFITDYGKFSRNLTPLLAALEERKIPYISEKANNWTDCASLEKHGRSDHANEKLFEQCCAKNLTTLADGRLYRCPFAANAFKLGAVPDYKADYLVLADTGRDAIRAFLQGKKSLLTCDHCNGRSYGDKVIEPAIQTKHVLRYFKYGT